MYCTTPTCLHSMVFNSAYKLLCSLPDTQRLNTQHFHGKLVRAPVSYGNTRVQFPQQIDGNVSQTRKKL